MSPEQMITITRLLNQVEPVSMREDGEVWILDLGGGKETRVYADGGQYWYLNGERHRTDGPAAIDANGTQHWYLNGKLHRTDGPAMSWANGAHSWYLNGEWLSEAEHAEAVAAMKKDS